MSTNYILAQGAQQNADYELHGISEIFRGWAGGRVALDSQRKSTPVAFTAEASSLVFTLDVASITNRSGVESVALFGTVAYVSIEALLNGRWQLLHTFERVSTLGVKVSPPVFGFFSTSDSLRASHYWVRSGDPTSTIRDGVTFAFGLTAKAL